MVRARFADAADPAVVLRCPCCRRGAIALGGPVATCTEATCRRRFRIVDDIPVLINPARSMFREEDFKSRATTTFKAKGTVAERIGRALPSPSRDVGQVRNYRRLAAALRANGQSDRLVLVIGSGDGSASYGDLVEVEGAVILETDVSLAGSAKVVCDASDLPFDDAVFDMVICQAVLEHVLEPQRCADEIHRVLKSGGTVYATTPFMQHVHMGEFDFTRFTRSGHRWLFRKFTELDSGVATGPASMLVWSIEYFLLSWTHRVWVRRVLKAATRLTLAWLTLLDPYLADRRAALDGSGGFYFIGRRADADQVTARDMIRYYRGADDVK